MMTAKEKQLENPGVKLDVSRVGRTVPYLEDARVGETIRFVYQGGSEDATRTVLVQAVEGEGVKGATLERDGAFRSYLDRNRVGSVAIVSPFVKDSEASATPVLVENRVRFDAAKSALLAVLTAEQLAELYKQHVAKDSKGVTYDANKGELVVKTDPPPATFNTERFREDRFHIANNGKKLEIFLYAGNKVGIDHHANGSMAFTSSNVTPQILLDELKKLLA